jgi:hypothetical protein
MTPKVWGIVGWQWVNEVMGYIKINVNELKIAKLFCYHELAKMLTLTLFQSCFPLEKYLEPQQKHTVFCISKLEQTNQKD